jgi:hypothetical protein
MTRSKSPSGIAPSRPTDALRDADPGAVDEDARRPVRLGRFGDGGGGSVRIGHVAGKADAADLGRTCHRCLDIDIQHGDLCACLRKHLCRCRAKPRCAARHDGGLSPQLHAKSFPC